MRSFGRSCPANTTAPPMTMRTSGYLSLKAWWTSAAILPMAASTSCALHTRSDASRKAQDSFGSGISGPAILQVFGECRSRLAVPHAVFDGRFQIAELAAAVVAPAADAHCEHALAREQRGYRIRELDLPSAARFPRGQHFEDRGGQDVAPDDAEGGLRVLGLRLLHD